MTRGFACDGIQPYATVCPPCLVYDEAIHAIYVDCRHDGVVDTPLSANVALTSVECKLNAILAADSAPARARDDRDLVTSHGREQEGTRTATVE